VECRVVRKSLLSSAGVNGQRVSVAHTVERLVIWVKFAPLVSLPLPEHTLPPPHTHHTPHTHDTHNTHIAPTPHHTPHTHTPHHPHTTHTHTHTHAHTHRLCGYTHSS